MNVTVHNNSNLFINNVSYKIYSDEIKFNLHFIEFHTYYKT